MPKKVEQPESEVKKNPVGRPAMPKTEFIVMLESPESVAVTVRYVEFLQHLFKNSETTNVYQLAKEMRIRESTLHRIIKNPNKYVLPVYAIWWAMEFADLNINWLFTGEGEMINQ
jgi:hypothetical protein